MPASSEHCNFMVSSCAGCPREPIGDCRMCGASICLSHAAEIDNDDDEQEEDPLCIECADAYEREPASMRRPTGAQNPMVSGLSGHGAYDSTAEACLDAKGRQPK